jgi:hypothetical protein
MSPDNSRPRSDPQVEGLVAEMVDAAVKKKVAEYKRVSLAFLAGVGVLFTVLIGSGLVSERSLILRLHDEIFGFESNLDRALSSNVAVSYSNEYWIGTHEDLARYQSVRFYADTTQRVQALIDIVHSGTGRKQIVAITVDTKRIWYDSADTTKVFDLTHDLLFERDISDRRDPVHQLTFAIVEGQGETGDRVLVRSLINVLGREKAGR